MTKPHIPLNELREQVSACHKCPLAEGRTQTVFGAGNPNARVLIIGEAPGRNEDLQGVPFVGAAGKKLDALLEIAGLDRERDVFIANVLKCRPPSNRDPKAEEIEMCSPFLREQTRTIDPQVIVTLGNFATKFILKTEVGITQLHGKVQHAGKFTVFPIYHPAAAIYDRKKQVALEEDFATLGRILNEMSASTGVGVAKPLEQGDGAIEEGQDETFDPVAYINDPSWHSSCYGLERIESLLDRMGRPQDKLKFVHVAGTNGKGSTSAYISSILTQAGYKTGLFTSPFIITFEERIRVNGQMIPANDLREVTLFVREHAEAIARETGEHPTEFELMTAVALEYFARSGCDIAVLEVGLGGTLDSTNVIAVPEVCVITRIGLDHTALLGDTYEQIASQKAGIIKSGASVVSYPQDDEGATRAIKAAALAADCTVTMPDFAQLKVGEVNGQAMRSFDYCGKAYRTSLLGAYQPCNAATAIECALRLRERGWKISDDDIERGIARARWQGRFEIVETGESGFGDSGDIAEQDGEIKSEGGCRKAGPAILVDGGHNPQGAQVLADSLRDLFPNKKILFVMSVLADKDYKSMIENVIDIADGFICVTPPNPRALQASELARAVEKAAYARQIELERGVSAAESFERALSDARAVSADGGVICAFGSLYSIADIKAAIEATR
mgnify:FL=1